MWLAKPQIAQVSVKVNEWHIGVILFVEKGKLVRWERKCSGACSENSLEGKFLKLYPGGGQMRAMFLSHPGYFATWQCPCLSFLIFMLSPSLTYAENTGELSSRSTPLMFTRKQDYSPGLFTLKLLQTGMALLPLMLGYIALGRKHDTWHSGVLLCGQISLLKNHSTSFLYFRAHLSISVSASSSPEPNPNLEQERGWGVEHQLSKNRCVSVSIFVFKLTGNALSTVASLILKLSIVVIHF